MSLRKVSKNKSRAAVANGPVDVNNLSLEEQFADHVNVAELDLIKDLDSEFFTNSYDLVQQLVPISSFAAGKMKRFVDILARMHTHYSNEVAASTEMQEKVNAAQKKLRLTLELTDTSNAMVEEMRESLAEAWRNADAAHNRETMLYGNIDSAYSEQPLKQSLEVDNTKNQNDMRFRALVFRERDRLARELKEHQKRLETNRFYSESMEGIIEDHRKMISTQQTRIKLSEREVFKLEHKLRICVETYDEKIHSQRKEIGTLFLANQNLRYCEKNYIDCKALNENLKQIIDKLSQENFNLQKINHRKEEEINHTKGLLTALESDVRALRRERAELDFRCRSILREMKKKDEIHLVLNRRFDQLSKKNSGLIEQELLLTNELMNVNKKLNIVTAKLDEALRQKEEGERSREKLRVEITNLNDNVSSIRYELVVQRGRTQETQFLLDSANILLDEKDAKMHKIVKERNDLVVESNALSKTIETLEDHVALKSERLAKMQEQLQHKQQEFQALKQQMETVHTEKVILQRSFAVCGQDRQTLQNINAKQAFQINQLCSQFATHEKETITLKNQIEQMHGLVKHKQNEIHAKERQLKSVRMELYEMKMRSGKLQHTIEEDEKRFKKITTTLEDERKSKNLAGKQMIRRNGELIMLREKLDMMQLALSRGTVQYNQRIDDIRLLKTEITNLRMSKDCLERSISSSVNMRHEVVRLERQLVRERLHVAAFTEELKHPYRIHRWRVLRGSDPHKYELIGKIQALLKRNIRLTVERRNLENKVQDVQRLYDTLKQQLQHVPDPSMQERLWLQQRINQRQIRKVKAMKAELAINEIDLQTRDVIIGEYQNALKKQMQPNPAIVQSVSCHSNLNEKFTKAIFQDSSSLE
ncbi:cilia- and flagella-associated protein 58 [Drosophila innubila]|uniref:cilia- and flagella-associated protein 58 n=1 Tax=Drosophila innubila TaxID=198719 RepID=UPI00148C2335|nr:cilia- and flagella-associated protein 58 [Drosophila innubila]